MKTHSRNIAVATLAATLFAAVALSAHTSVSVSIGVPAPVIVASAPAPVIVAAPAPAPMVVAQAPSAQVVVAAPAPVAATMAYYPEYYTWDGFEYVGVIGGNYFYLGAGNMWISCEPWRAHRFHEWEHYHRDWHRQAIHNEHYRHGPPPPPRR